MINTRGKKDKLIMRENPRKLRRPPTMEVQPGTVKNISIREGNSHSEIRNMAVPYVSQKSSKFKNDEMNYRKPSLENKQRPKIPTTQDILNEETLATLKDEIAYLWEIYKIDPYYKDAYLKALSNLSTQAYIEQLAKEIDLLYKEKSTIQKLYSHIRKREDILLQIEKISEYFKNNPESGFAQKINENIMQLLEDLRICTLFVVETSIKLRGELSRMTRFSTEPLKILFNNGQDYLLKIYEDYSKIINSEISKMFKFGKKFDPFFMGISQPVPLQKTMKPLTRQLGKRANTAVINMQNQELLRKTTKSSNLFLTVPIGLMYKRMKLAEEFLNQEFIKNNDNKTEPDFARDDQEARRLSSDM